MPYLNLDLDYFTHPKVTRLESILNEYQGVNMFPVKLWCYAGKHFSQTGVLTSCTKLSIEKALGWSGEDGKLVNALVQTGFMDMRGTEYRIHDWKHHAGHLGAFKRRAITAAKTRWQKYASSKRQADDKQALAYALGSSSLSSSSPSSSDEGKKEKKEKRADPAAPVPCTLETFAMTPDLEEWAVKEHIPNPTAYLEEFKDYWRSVGGKRGNGRAVQNWESTFKNRLRDLKKKGQLLAGASNWQEDFLNDETGLSRPVPPTVRRV